MVRTMVLAPFLWLVASAAMPDVPRAIAAWSAGDYYAAFAAAIEPANEGDAAAQFMIGEAYRLGNGVAADRLSAEVWYFRAAKRGHVGAAAELGTLYAGDGRVGDAEHWLAFAAERGDAGAQGALAALYFNHPDAGHGTREALALMARAAAAGSPQAKVQLARMQALTGIPAPVADLSSAPAPAAAAPPATPAPVASTDAGAPVPHHAVAPGRWRVQVGAFRSRRDAGRAWAMLAGRVTAIARADRVLVPMRTFIQLQALSPSRAKARALCRAVQTAGWSCFVPARPMVTLAALGGPGGTQSD